MSCFEKWSVWITSFAVLATGVVYGWMKYFMTPLEPWAVINHPLQPWVLKAHIVTAPLLVFSVGLITMRHIWQHYKCRIPLGRRSGIVTALMMAPMVISGYLIQAITHETWLQAMAVSHIGFGLIYGLGLALHQLFVWKRPGNRTSQLPQLKGTPEQVRVPERAGVGGA